MAEADATRRGDSALVVLIEWYTSSTWYRKRVCNSSGNNGGEDEIRVRYRRH